MQLSLCPCRKPVLSALTTCTRFASAKKKRGKKGEDQKRLGRVGNYPGTDQGSGVCYLLCSSLL